MEKEDIRKSHKALHDFIRGNNSGKGINSTGIISFNDFNCEITGNDLQKLFKTTISIQHEIGPDLLKLIIENDDIYKYCDKAIFWPTKYLFQYSQENKILKFKYNDLIIYIYSSYE